MLSDKELVLVHKLLKELEWRSEAEYCSVCPSCYQCAHEHRGRKGHDKDCELAAVLALLEAKMPKLATS